MSYLPAEWHKQSLIQLTWPHKDTDWAYMLDEVNDCFLKIAYEVLKRQSLLIVAPDPDSIRDSIDNYGADIQKLVTSKINTNDTEMIQNYRRYRHTSGNGRKERTHAKNEQETAAGMVFFPAASESRKYHLRPYHIQRPLPGLYP